MNEYKPPLTPEEPPPPNRRAAAYVGLCLAVAVASLLYRILVLGGVEQTSLMFIGLPAVLAILISLAPPAKTVTGMIFKGITLFLLLLGILFIEGFICILMAAPLFYAIGFIVGIFADKARARRETERRFRIVVLPVLILMSLEGITGTLSFPRNEVVIISRDTTRSPAETRLQLARGPRFDLDALPSFLKLGFPRPVAIEGYGVERGDQWTIRFAGGEGKPGDLVVEVVESSDDHLRLKCVKDSSHIAHWLEWQEIEWKLEPMDGGTRVTTSFRYRRLLDPAWYFKPIERYGVRKAGEYFIIQTFGDLMNES